MTTQLRTPSFWLQFSLRAKGHLGPKVVTAARGMTVSWCPAYWATLPSAVFAIVTQDSGRSGAVLPAVAGSLFLIAAGVDVLRSVAVPRLFQNHAAGKLTTSDFIERTEAKEWWQARGRVLLFCAVGLVLVALATMAFAGRWPVAALGAALLASVTLRLAGFWPLRRSLSGGWLFRAALPAEVVMSALRGYSWQDRHVLAWTQAGRLSLLRRAAADMARVDPNLARLMAARHASDSVFPRVTYRGGGLVADLHLLWIGGRLVGRVMALSCALAVILSFALPRGAFGTWPDLSGLPFLEGLRDEAPKDPPTKEQPPTENNLQNNGPSAGGGGGRSGQPSGGGERNGENGGRGQDSGGQGSGDGGDTGQGGGSGAQDGAEVGAGQSSPEEASGKSGSAGNDSFSHDAGPGSAGKGSSGSGEAEGQGDPSSPSTREAGGGAQHAPSGGWAGEGAGAGQGAAGQVPSAGPDTTQRSDPSEKRSPGSDVGGQAEAPSGTEGSAAATPLPSSKESGRDGPAPESPSAAEGNAAQGSDSGAEGRPGNDDAAQGADSATGAGGNGPADGTDADPNGMAEGSSGGAQSGAGRAGASGATDPAEAAVVPEGAAPEPGSTGVVVLPSQGQGEADIPPDALVVRGAGQAPETEGETASVGSAAQLYAEPGHVPDTIETRLFPDETIPPPPVAPDPPRQMLPAWIRLILEENR